MPSSLGVILIIGLLGAVNIHISRLLKSIGVLGYLKNRLGRLRVALVAGGALPGFLGGPPALIGGVGG